jgi:D-hexose-6-phosphate mutarotase
MSILLALLYFRVSLKQTETSKFFPHQIRLRFDLSFSLTAECYWYKKSELHAGPLLSKRLQRYFQYKLIQCVEYDNLNEEQEREIFQVCFHDTIV